MKKLLASVCVISFFTAAPAFAGGIEKETEQYRDAPPPTLVYKKPTTEPKNNRNGGERKNPPTTKPEPEPEKPVDPEPEDDPCACGPEWQAEQANKV